MSLLQCSYHRKVRAIVIGDTPVGKRDGSVRADAFLDHLTDEKSYRITHSPYCQLPSCHTRRLRIGHLTLSRLPQLRIKDGDINKHNFVIHDGKATIIDAASRLAATSWKARTVGLQPRTLNQFRDTSNDAAKTD
jgi:hypothetical protein